jgi:hypothetical protein
MIFILPLLALAVCFYGYVFVNFQKELAGNRRRKILGAMTIPLHVQHCQENEPEQSSILASVRGMEVARHVSEANPGPRPVRPVIAWRQRPSEGFYQLESPFLGPLFLVPRRDGRVNRSARAAHSRLVSAMGGTAPGDARRKSAAECSHAGSDNENVIQITAKASARG